MNDQKTYKTLAEQREQEWIAKLLDPRMRASWRARLVCFFYDCIYVFLILFLASVFTTIWMLIAANPPYDLQISEYRQYFLDHHPEMFVVDRIIKVILVALYFFIIPAFLKDPRTLGMASFGVSIMGSKGEEITGKLYLKRALLSWVLSPGFILAFGPERRALHDRLTDTYVVLN